MEIKVLNYVSLGSILCCSTHDFAQKCEGDFIVLWFCVDTDQALYLHLQFRFFFGFSYYCVPRCFFFLYSTTG